MRTESFLALDSGGFHRVVYREWGSRENQRVVVCVHGLARNSRDFDDLALTLSRSFRVICPDIAGRGESDWLSNPADYQIAQYLQDMTALIARLDVPNVDWVGTSMGGIIGMCLASMPNSPIRRLVLNDIGGQVPSSALQRIASYLTAQCYPDEQQALAIMQQNYPALAGISGAQWQHLLRYQYRHTEAGFEQHYDPAIGDNVRAVADSDIELWEFWRQVNCPQLLLWGELSDVLTRETVNSMKQQCPELELETIAGIGHAPSLMEDFQIQRICDWLRQPVG